jgi:hypothetical protein
MNLEYINVHFLCKVVYPTFISGNDLFNEQ